MSYIQLTDDDLQEASCVSNLLAALSQGSGDPVVLLDTLRNASDAEIAEIANECAARADDIAATDPSDEELLQLPRGEFDVWASQLRCIASELRSPQEPRNVWPAEVRPGG